MSNWRHDFLGNAAAPHLRSWVELVASKTEVHAHDIARKGKDLIGPPVAKLHRYDDWLMRNSPKLVRYVLLGRQLRKRDDIGLIHAQNTSGFGMSAMLSGKPYVITTFGSEIFHADKRGRVYKKLIHRILHKALMVTASTPAMAEELRTKFDMPPEKIFCSNFVDPRYSSAPPVEKSHGPPIFLANRRLLPFYKTLETVAAFKRYRDEGGKGRLILMEGDSEPDYVRKVKAVIAGREDIELVEGFVDRATVLELLRKAHFAISIPPTDQFSHSILEGATALAVPLLRPLKSYRPIFEHSVLLDESLPLEDGLVKAFREAGEMSHEERTRRGHAARQLVHDEFLDTVFVDKFVRALEEREIIPPQDDLSKD